MTTPLLCYLLEVEVARSFCRESLGGQKDTASVYTEYHCIRSHTHSVSIVPVRDRRRIGELPVLIHEVKLIPRQKHSQNQFHLQLGQPGSRTGVPARSPTEERIGSVRNRVRSQPPTRIILVRFRVVIGVEVGVSRGMHKEIPPSDHFSGDFHLFAEVRQEY